MLGRLRAEYPFLAQRDALRLIRTYGTDAFLILGGATSAAGLGRDFGAGLSESEVRWLVAHEFARSATDVIWRRTRLGLRMSAEQTGALEEFMADLRAGVVASIIK